jgi:hypothetical protein
MSIISVYIIYKTNLSHSQWVSFVKILQKQQTNVLFLDQLPGLYSIHTNKDHWDHVVC